MTQIIPNLTKVINAIGLRQGDCHRELPRNSEYFGLALGGGAICVEEAIFLAGLIFCHRPHKIIELGTSSGASALCLAATCLDVQHGDVTTVDIAPGAPSVAFEIAEKFDLPLGFLCETNSIDFLNSYAPIPDERYLVFSDTEIAVRPEEVKLILGKFPRGTLIVVHDTSDLHPVGPMKLYEKIAEPMVQVDTPRGITLLKVR